MESTTHDFRRWYGSELAICTEVDDGKLTVVKVLEKRVAPELVAMECGDEE